MQSITRVDFTHYRDSTLRRRIRRRIRRRMALTKQESLADYTRHLQENRAEIGALFRDILINVTRFFRDPEVFLTTSGENKDIDQAYELGANAFLMKPTSVELLASRMKALKIFWLDRNTFPERKKSLVP